MEKEIIRANKNSLLDLHLFIDGIDIVDTPRFYTSIYIKKKFFKECSYKNLNIRNDDIAKLVELIDKKDLNLKDQKDAKTIFWVCCAKMKLWFKQNYDTNLIDWSLALQLLNELMKAGEPLAKIKFKEEILLGLVENKLVDFKYINYLDSTDIAPIFPKFIETCKNEDKLIKIIWKLIIGKILGKIEGFSTDVIDALKEKVFRVEEKNPKFKLLTGCSIEEFEKKFDEDYLQGLMNQGKKKFKFPVKWENNNLEKIEVFDFLVERSKNINFEYIQCLLSIPVEDLIDYFIPLKNEEILSILLIQEKDSENTRNIKRELVEMMEKNVNLDEYDYRPFLRNIHRKKIYSYDSLLNFLNYKMVLKGVDKEQL